MLGAIIGDIAGSRFEWNNIKSKEFDLLTYKCDLTDDSIMTLAIANAILDSDDDYSNLSVNAVKNMQTLGRKYPNAGYGGSFRKWLDSDDPKPYGSFGNGAAMRVSACAYAAKDLSEAKRISRIVTEVTHNHPEGIKAAEAVTVAIYMALHGSSIFKIRDEINNNYYPLNFSLDLIRDAYKFDVSCQGSVPQAIEAFIESTGYEDTIRNAISKSMAELPADNLEDLETKTVISVVLDYIAEIGYYYQNQRMEDPYSDVKSILIKLDKKYGVREKIDELIDGIELTIENMSNVFGYNPTVYVDGLFGYKTSSQLSSEFMARYGMENVSVDDEEKRFSISIRVDDLNKNKSIPIKLINNIIDSLYETEKNYSRIKIVYYDKNNQIIEYDIEFVKKAKHINRVVQKSTANGKTISKECKRRQTVFAPDFSF